MDKTMLFNLDQINDFTNRWFKALDVHTSPEEMGDYLMGDDFILVVPEGKFEKLDGFNQWYGKALNRFFDEEHTLKEVSITDGDARQVTVKVVVNWQASVWDAPEPRSKRINATAYQTWIMAAAGDDPSPRILKYIVDDFRYEEGSATL